MFAGRGVLAGRENERTAPTQVSISAERSKGYGRTHRGRRDGKFSWEGTAGRRGGTPGH